MKFVMGVNVKRSVLLLSCAIVGCGGGGGDDPAPAATTSYPLRTGYVAYVSGGSSANYTISGSCSGNATLSSTATSAATFEGTQGFSSVQTLNMNFTNCTPTPISAVSTSYYDANYTPIGSSASTEYAKFSAAMAQIPASVKVGDSGTIGSMTVYSSSAKTTITGSRTLSYVIEPDTASTVIANLTTKAYNTSNQLLFTQQSRFRVASNGAVTPTSIDIQYATTSTNHLVLTKN